MLRTTRVALLSRRGFHNFAGSIVPTKSGLYDPAHEKDSCGVGFVVDGRGLGASTRRATRRTASPQ